MAQARVGAGRCGRKKKGEGAFGAGCKRAGEGGKEERRRRLGRGVGWAGERRAELGRRTCGAAQAWREGSGSGWAAGREKREGGLVGVLGFKHFQMEFEFIFYWNLKCLGYTHAQQILFKPLQPREILKNFLKHFLKDFYFKRKF